MTGKREDHERIDDILAAIASIDAYAALDREALGIEDVVEDAVKYNFVVIGEAVGDLSDEIKDRFPDIPWPRIKGMRNFMAHRYHRVSMDVIWTTVEKHLPPLKDVCLKIARELPGAALREDLPNEDDA